MNGPTRIIRKPLQLATVLTALVVMSSSLGCAFGEIYWTDPFTREFSLTEIQKRYTNLVRFGAFIQASKFVDPEVTSAFLDGFPSKGTLVFTDFDSEQILFNEDGKRAQAMVRVTYSAYYTNNPVVFEIIEEQEWIRKGLDNTWIVRPSFSGLSQLASAQ